MSSSEDVNDVTVTRTSTVDSNHPKEHETSSKHSSLNSNSSEQSKISFSKFPIFCVDYFDDSCAIQVVVLNYWDNICGPRIHGAWIVNKIPTSDEKYARNDVDWGAMDFMGRQILCGEIMKDPGDSLLETKVYDSPEKRMAVAAVAFGAVDQGEMKIHSLCLVPHYDQLKQFLNWKDVCFQWLVKCVLQLRITLATNVTAGYTIIKDDLRRLVEIMEYKDYFSDLKVSHTLFYEMTPNRDFLCEMLVAYLCQGHQAVVMGRNAEEVNKVMRTLMMFVLPHRRHRCRLLESEESTFAPELHLQGLYNDIKQIESVLSSVKFCLQPTALINCDEKNVSILCWCEDYNELRLKFLASELGQLWNECSVRKQDLSHTFKTFKRPNSMIYDFLEELSCLPNELKKSYICNFTRNLSRKALLFSQSLELTKQNPKKQMGIYQSEGDLLHSIFSKRFSYTSEWDTHMISSFPYCLPCSGF